MEKIFDLDAFGMSYLNFKWWNDTKFSLQFCTLLAVMSSYIQCVAIIEAINSLKYKYKHTLVEKSLWLEGNENLSIHILKSEKSNQETSTLVSRGIEEKSVSFKITFRSWDMRIFDQN